MALTCSFLEFKSIRHDSTYFPNKFIFIAIVKKQSHYQPYDNTPGKVLLPLLPPSGPLCLISSLEEAVCLDISFSQERITNEGLGEGGNLKRSVIIWQSFETGLRK
jgi:hypothetical protein